MRDIIADLKALRLHGMASTWAEMLESEGHGSLSVQTTRPVLADCWRLNTLIAACARLRIKWRRRGFPRTAI